MPSFSDTAKSVMLPWRWQFWPVVLTIALDLSVVYTLLRGLSVTSFVVLLLKISLLAVHNYKEILTARFGGELSVPVVLYSRS